MPSANRRVPTSPEDLEARDERRRRPNGFGKVDAVGPWVDPDAEKVLTVSYRVWLWMQHNEDTRFAPLARLVLGGGPDSIWVNRPLKSDQVLRDVEGFFLAERHGITEQHLLLATEAVEAHAAERRLTKAEMEEFKQNQRDKAAQQTLAHAREVAASVIEVELGETAVAEDLEEIKASALSGLGRDSGVIVRTRCTYIYAHANARYRVGDRCKGPALPGNTKCEYHGGQLIDSEETRRHLARAHGVMVRASEAAVMVVIDILQNSPNEQLRLKAAEMLLDRAGLAVGADVEKITGKPSGGKDALAGEAVAATDALRERLMRLAAGAPGGQVDANDIAEVASDLSAVQEEQKRDEAESGIVEGDVISGETA